jgi:hypothetical protein
MAEIHNYTMNFSCGRPIKLDLTSLRELACTEIHADFFDICMQYLSEKV